MASPEGCAGVTGKDRKGPMAKVGTNDKGGGHLAITSVLPPTWSGGSTSAVDASKACASVTNAYVPPAYSWTLQTTAASAVAASAATSATAMV